MKWIEKLLSLFVKKKECRHRHIFCSEETGYYCMDCGAGGFKERK